MPQNDNRTGVPGAIGGGWTLYPSAGML